MSDKYDHNSVEVKWQDRWGKDGQYVIDANSEKKSFYNLWMFPYPSAEGLHAGHAFASTGSDIYGRYMRMNDREVFQPIGYDSFGIHSENYAIKIGEDPHEVVKRTTKNYERQMRSLGHGYDWTRTVTTSDVDYYKWTQWLFLKMFEAGLAYKKKAAVNFCPSCKTVLADEQVMTPKQAGKEPKDKDGNVVSESEFLKVCERCGTIVEKKELEQWFFKITDYSDRLLSGLDKIDWSNRVITAQRNWIGKSEGRIIEFGGGYEVFTTRPDTLNAVTFLATSGLYGTGGTEKIGKFTGNYAVSPLDGRKIPVWDTNYVAPDYGTGLIMGVPAHDERDREFATKYGIDILEKDPEENDIGEKHTNYHLRDWLISRQRYWGAPIPMIYCEDHGWVPVAEKDLPVLLPNISDYKPEGNGKGPLANHKDFYKTECPICGKQATRETDVMDTFVDSSWYFLRYPSVTSKSASKSAFDKEITQKWLPVDLYFGGAEHSVLHLMYARFITMVLHDLKLIDFDEPFPKFFAHGLMIKDGAKMSKSRGNVVNPDEYVSKYGADTLRLYLVFMGPMDGYPDFRDSGIEGMQRFVNRLWKLFNDKSKDRGNETTVVSKLHQTIKGVTDDIQNFKYNTAIAKIMELVNVLYETGNRSPEILKDLCLLVAPFAPHLAEEVWVDVLGQPYSVHKSAWPVYKAEFVKSDETTIVIQVNGRVRGTIKGHLPKSKEEIEALVRGDDSLAKWIKDKEIKKVIFIPSKLINFVL